MWSTGNCVQYVVYILHPLRKCSLISSCTKIHKQKNKNDPLPPLEPCWRPHRIVTQHQREYLCPFQFQKLEWVEYDNVDTEEFIIPEVLSTELGTPVIKSQESCWSEEWKLNILFYIVLCLFKDILSFALVPLTVLCYILSWVL